MSQISSPPLVSNSSKEISFIDIMRFLKSAWKTIITAGLCGLALSIVYLAITPKQYEATAQIVLAQIGNSNTNSNANFLGVNVEDPAQLISRMSLPTSYPLQLSAACGLEDDGNKLGALSKVIKIVPIKGVTNLVELKTVGPSQEAALNCASAIYGLIKDTQAQILAPYVDEAKIKLADDEARLGKARDLVSRADKSGSAMSAAYLSTRDEIRFLLDEITSLKNVVISNQNRMTHLNAPIYVSDVPISPKARMTLAGGIFGGLFVGLVIAMVSQMILRIKRESVESVV